MFFRLSNKFVHFGTTPIHSTIVPWMSLYSLTYCPIFPPPNYIPPPNDKTSNEVVLYGVPHNSHKDNTLRVNHNRLSTYGHLTFPYMK